MKSLRCDLGGPILPGIGWYEREGDAHLSPRTCTHYAYAKRQVIAAAARDGCSLPAFTPAAGWEQR